MVDATGAYTEAANIINSYGEICSVQTFVRINNSGSTYDDDIVLGSSTTVWTTGLVFPLGHPRKGSKDAVLMEQGKLAADDSIIYLAGSISLSGGAVKIRMGSPADETYYLLEKGTDEWTINGKSAYRKAYMRLLTNGSFIGEA